MAIAEGLGGSVSIAEWLGPPSLVTWFLFSKILCVATLLDFGEKRCRRNLPLSVTSFSGTEVAGII